MKTTVFIEIGKRYNNWKVLKEVFELGPGKYLCECICGVQRPVLKYNLGIVNGCGCVRNYTGMDAKGAVLYRPKKPNTKAKSATTAKLVTNKPKQTDEINKRTSLNIASRHTSKPRPISLAAKNAAAVRVKSEDLREKLRLKRELEEYS